MKIDENDGNDGNDGHIYRLKKIDEIQKILTAEREINEMNLVQNITEEKYYWRDC